MLHEEKVFSEGKNDQLAKMLMKAKQGLIVDHCNKVVNDGLDQSTLGGLVGKKDGLKWSPWRLTKGRKISWWFCYKRKQRDLGKDERPGESFSLFLELQILNVWFPKHNPAKSGLGNWWCLRGSNHRMQVLEEVRRGTAIAQVRRAQSSLLLSRK